MNPMDPQPPLPLRVEGLRKTFKDKRGLVEAIKGVSFSIGQGEMVGLLGPNGAGKTTTIKCILGLVRPDQGTIRVFDLERDQNPREVAKKMAAVLEGARNIYWRLTVWENILYFAGIHGVSLSKGKSYFEYLLETLKLADKRDTEVRNLSSGYKQKTAVACALAKMTPIVFLDEPTLGLDVESSYELRAALKELQRKEKRTIVVSSHDMRVIQDICRRVIIVSGGRIVTDQDIQSLLSLFRKRAYRVVLARNGYAGGRIASDGDDAGAIASTVNTGAGVTGTGNGTGCNDETLKSQLLQTFPEATVAVTPDTLEITVNLTSPVEIYELVGVLREHGAAIDAISREEVDLEKAFLEIVRKERSECGL